MKYFYKLMAVLVLLFPSMLKAQTNLAAGDILFTAYNSTPTTGTADKFSFVLLKDISTQTVIYFTQFTYTWDSSLPVTLTKFTAKAEGNNAKLEWQTASEQNNKAFEIYRSGDDKILTKIATLAGSGTTTSINTYVYVDKMPLKGHNYYRLVQIDGDGNYENLGERMLSFKVEKNAIIVYSNPTTSIAHLKFVPGYYQRVVLTSIHGRVLHINA